MRRGVRIAALGLVLVAVGVGAWLAVRGAGRGESPTMRATIGGESFILEVAGDEAARERGLSGRGPLSPNRGMVFLFAEPRMHAFVMRGVASPLDLLYVDHDGRVVAIVTMAVEPPQGRDESDEQYLARLVAYISPRPVDVAIELAAGTAERLHLRTGDRIGLEPRAR